MSKTAVFLLISSFFLLGALIATGVVWYLLVVVPLQEESTSVENNTITPSQPIEEPRTPPVIESTEDEPMRREVPSETPTIPTITEPIVIPLSSLTPTQQTLAQTLGVVENEAIVVTPEAQMCAEAKLGSARLAEIIAGDTPSITEGFALVNCL